jgi:hypothetical protein
MRSTMHKVLFGSVCAVVVSLGFIRGVAGNPGILGLKCKTFDCVTAPGQSFPGFQVDCTTAVCNDCTANNPGGQIKYCVQTGLVCRQLTTWNACAGTCAMSGAICYICQKDCI